MNIHKAILDLNKLVPDVDKFVSLWKIEQAIDNNKSFIVPSYVLYPHYERSISVNAQQDQEILGLPIGNYDFLHSLFIWSMNPKTVVVSETVMDFIYKSSLLDYISPELLFSFPSQAILVNQKFGNYDGIMFCKDFIDDGFKKQYSLNISLFSNDGRYGKYFSFVLPTGEQFNPFQDFKENPEWSNVAFVFYVLFYVLNEYLHKQDILNQEGIDYMGFHLEQKIEQHRFLSGSWRNAHWHTYQEKRTDGKLVKSIKWIQPTWIAY
ncbi:hypothetical protein [Acinetobacter indicus]|uniref:hypothetical protein n=1 Tax=Acinetobacter indicus TaxID=756892 RepID=UPI003988D4E7